MTNCKKEYYKLEGTEYITIAELIVKLKDLPQEDFCDDPYIEFYKEILEDPIATLKAQISNIEQSEKIAIEHSKKKTRRIIKL